MSRTLTITAEPDDRLQLTQAWIDGEGDGAEFTLTCGAGLGSGHVRLTVKVGETRVTESFDIRDLTQAWAKQIIAEIADANTTINTNEKEA